MNNNEDGNDNAFRRTQRMQTMSGLTPTYSPGEFVFLSTPMPGFADGTRFKVVGARAVGANQHRYELQANGQTVWVLEADLRSTPPDGMPEKAGQGEPDALSVTQRMQTMTLTQRMAALGLGGTDTDGATTQRLKVLSADTAPRAPDINGPATGSPFAANPSSDKSKPGGKS